MEPKPPNKLAAESAGIDWHGALEECWGWMRTVVRSRVGDAEAADDVMQEVALAVLEQPVRPTDPQKAAPWLYRIAVRHSANFWRRKGRSRRLISRFGAETATDHDPAPNPREWVMQAETHESVARSLEHLPPIDRDALLLKYVEGWSYRQLAQRLGVTEKTIEHRLARARKALRSQLSRKSGE